MIAGIKLVFSLFIYELLVASTFRLIKFFFLYSNFVKSDCRYYTLGTGPCMGVWYRSTLTVNRATVTTKTNCLIPMSLAWE